MCPLDRSGKPPAPSSSVHALHYRGESGRAYREPGRRLHNDGTYPCPEESRDFREARRRWIWSWTPFAVSVTSGGSGGPAQREIAAILDCGSDESLHVLKRNEGYVMSLARLRTLPSAGLWSVRRRRPSRLRAMCALLSPQGTGECGRGGEEAPEGDRQGGQGYRFPWKKTGESGLCGRAPAHVVSG